MRSQETIFISYDEFEMTGVQLHGGHNEVFVGKYSDKLFALKLLDDMQTVAEEKMKYDLMRVFGVVVPDTYIVQDEVSEKCYIASEIIPYTFDARILFKSHCEKSPRAWTFVDDTLLEMTDLYGNVLCISRQELFGPGDYGDGKLSGEIKSEIRRDLAAFIFIDDGVPLGITGIKTYGPHSSTKDFVDSVPRYFSNLLLLMKKEGEDLKVAPIKIDGDGLFKLPGEFKEDSTPGVDVLLELRGLSGDRFGHSGSTATNKRLRYDFFAESKPEEILSGLDRVCEMTNEQLNDLIGDERFTPFLPEGRQEAIMGYCREKLERFLEIRDQLQQKMLESVGETDFSCVRPSGPGC
jgi:hypothetical protein